MSVDIAWDTVTSGPDGDALGEKIRDFIHTKFQQITLPRFINSVHVHSFEFGSICPEIEIKDISDPLPDFYEDDESSVEDTYSGKGPDGGTPPDSETTKHDPSSASRLTGSFASDAYSRSPIEDGSTYSSVGVGANALKTQAWMRSLNGGSAETKGLMFPGSSTPGIPGGTSNLSYFHLPVGHLSGAQTPLAAVASGTPFPPGMWQHESLSQRQDGFPGARLQPRHDRPSTSDSIPSPELGSPFDPSSPETRPVAFPNAEKVSDDLDLEDLPASPPLRDVHRNPSDLQVVARVTYDGDVRMTLTAEILLDYPMPSFVNIPLKLSVTGMKFDGVAILAYIKKKMHFAFLDPEDAQTLVGDQLFNESHDLDHKKDKSSSTFGSLLREVRIESEIGQQTNGRQVLKNVGKVEKFVLEQVKKIFEEEFVFPSFWTFLV